MRTRRLDTNVASELRRAKPHGGGVAWLNIIRWAITLRSIKLRTLVPIAAIRLHKAAYVLRSASFCSSDAR